MNLGEIGVFISSVLLSLGGMVAVVFASCRQSRCKKIEMCGIVCDRENLPDEEVINV